MGIPAEKISILSTYNGQKACRCVDVSPGFFQNSLKKKWALTNYFEHLL